MSQIAPRIDGRAGRITLTRPEALNALSYEMCRTTEAALNAWRDDPRVDLVLLEAEGDRAFCAGGDIAEMYHTGRAGDYDYGRRFWRDEYRMNAKLAEYPKPVVSFLHGFVMGGGVGLGGHVSHRIVCDSTQMSMPECGIGFVPDVGGSFRLARAPGHLGKYLGLTASRMGPGDAIHAGFADHYLPDSDWPALKQALVERGDAAEVARRATPAPDSPLAEAQEEIDHLFGADSLDGILARLRASDSPLAAKALKALSRSAPLSMAVTLEMIRRLRAPDLTIRDALELEYRVSHRIMEHGDFLEGIRAAIIDKDRTPRWRHAEGPVPSQEVAAMLAPLGAQALDFREEHT
ncbi:enoyl-CoA hydratase/isomerase family protein [Pseudoponticoccus marisrubri]|uniref:3-hydroxyisobutyryl-CoA hydrolase n=1 Tax=Pseudoponticoccus marisrubri TaxID=1685382 RepID=A0A0W7WMP5_9RHOB|nr:enoyl-CoA hydratase/isomerase family protein [Pseudoponticoccus marisrubri]KUF11859.1 enoyl-CoA hydratase [Pseudoponticoccus marisrubri]